MSVGLVAATTTCGTCCEPVVTLGGQPDAIEVRLYSRFEPVARLIGGLATVGHGDVGKIRLMLSPASNASSSDDSHSWKDPSGWGLARPTQCEVPPRTRRVPGSTGPSRLTCFLCFRCIDSPKVCPDKNKSNNVICRNHARSWSCVSCSVDPRLSLLLQ
jgi:hypothetical protein